MIRAARLIEHHWRLGAAAQSAAGTWTERRSLLLVLEDGDGHWGLGEAAPLPGYSGDTLSEAHTALTGLFGKNLPRRDLGVPCGVDLGRVSAFLPSPSARAALETALLDLWAQQSGVPAWAALGADRTATSAPVAAWLPDGTDAALAAARASMERGVRAFKVKLDARGKLEHGIATLVALREALGPDVTLRADANQSATASDLAPHLETLRALELEWLEEPTAEPLSKPLGVPVALDESLQASALPELAQRPDVAALVLKPTALGGITRCLELAVHALAHGRVAVASHCLEGPAGFMAAATLALALPRGAAHGLGPYERVAGSARPPVLAAESDTLTRWYAPGLGLSLEQALQGATVSGTVSA